jgi:urease accessory protein
MPDCRGRWHLQRALWRRQQRPERQLGIAGWRLSLPDLRERLETGRVRYQAGWLAGGSYQRGDPVQQPGGFGGILSPLYGDAMTQFSHLVRREENLPRLSSSGTPDASKERPSDRDLQRADGCARVVLIGSENGTRVEDIFERSPIRVMFPRTGHRAVEEGVLINTAGGVAGGDRLELCVTALPGASIAVTSQAAEKVYRALNEPARVATRLKAHESARLAWLPQETIVFNWACLHRTTEIELFRGAELLALEWLVLGRAAHGEVVIGGNITDSWRVKRDGRLAWADSFRITDEIFPHLHRKALLSDCHAIATLLYFGPHLDKRLEFLREIIPSLGCNCAATLVSGLIVVRFAAKEPSDLKLALRSFLQQFGPELGSGPFRVPKMWSC